MVRLLLMPFMAAASIVLASHAALAADPPPYHRIAPAMAGKTVTLTGHDLTLEQVIDVARYGAKVAVTAPAKQRMKDNYGLLLEGSTEGVSIYWFNRGAGGARETVMFAGNPESPENYPKVADTQMRAFRGGASGGYGPEIADEELVRAIMVIRANAMTWNAPSPGLAQMLVDLINHRITPVVNSRGTVGEGDLAALSNIGATMVGAGDAYLDGVRMPAAEALAKAVRPEPFILSKAGWLCYRAAAAARRCSPVAQW